MLSLPEVFDVVKKAKMVPEAGLIEAQKTAEHLKVPLTKVLLGRRLVEKDKLGELLASAMGVRYIDLRKYKAPEEVLSLVGEETAIEQRSVPFGLSDNRLGVAMADPQDLEALNVLRKLTGKEIVPYFAFDDDIKLGLKQYKGSLVEEFRQLLGQVAKDKLGAGSLVELAEDVSVVEAVNRLLEYAVVEGASDIHIEALSKSTLIRYRVDGVLNDVLELPKELHSAMVARIKILSGLKLDETRQPQDGRIKFVSDEGDEVSLRVSVLPVVEGEKVVLRVLESGEAQFSFEGLGFGDVNAKLVQSAMKKPHGLILVTGPTGSGKTTTLYTMLSMLNTSEVNVSTVEDPVENRIRRVNQMQVNSRIELSFAKGLRALLRQDPDIIMVGEIRDGETAQMAVNASMTGHLVLSTLHTNDAPGAVPRMIDLGAEAFLVASTVELIIAQRLVRKICSSCRASKPIDQRWVEYLNKAIKDPQERELVMKVVPKEVSFGKKCNACGFSGYQGRVGVFEMFAVDDQVRELILGKATASQIKELALQKGMKTMMIDGLEKVSAGVTTMEEVLRVALG